MTTEVAIVGGLGVISAIFGYYAFEFKNSPGDDLMQKLAVFLFFMSLVFLDLVMFTVYRLSDQQGFTYLTDGIMRTGLMIVTWTTVILTFALLLGLIISLIRSLWVYYKAIGRNL